MPARPKKNRDEIQGTVPWDEIDESRDAQLSDAVDKASLEDGSGKRDFKWFDRHEAALIAHEEGRSTKLINLETSLGMYWNGHDYDRACTRVASRAEVESLVESVCEEIRRINRPRSWLNRIFSFR